MEVVLYQFGILIAIIISASYGKSSRNVAVILISIFTILQVYFSGLLILQFFTIFMSFYISKAIFPEKKIMNERPKFNIDNYPNLKLLEEQQKEDELKKLELIKKSVIEKNYISKLSPMERLEKAIRNKKLEEENNL
jgi:hypothetical protein